MRSSPRGLAAPSLSAAIVARSATLQSSPERRATSRFAVSDMRLEVKGLNETVRAFSRLEKGSGPMVRRELATVAEPVANKAREIAVARGLVGATKNLSRRIKPFATGRAIGVRETAKRKGGYQYPKVYEYGKRAVGESVGPRAFLYPAAKWGRPEAERRLATALDRLTRAF